MLKEYLFVFFRGAFFRLRGIFEKTRKTAFGGDLTGFAASRDLILALARRAKQGRFSRFRYFRCDRCPVPTTRKTSRSHLLRSMASGETNESRAMVSRGGGVPELDGLRRNSFDFCSLAVYFTVGFNAISSFGVGQPLAGGPPNSPPAFSAYQIQRKTSERL